MSLGGDPGIVHVGRLGFVGAQGDPRAFAGVLQPGNQSGGIFVCELLQNVFQRFYGVVTWTKSVEYTYLNTESPL